MELQDTDMGHSGAQEIIDVHCHCFAGRQQVEIVAAGIAGLRAAGVSCLAVMGLVNTCLDVRDVWALVPEGFDYFGDPSYNETEDLLHFNAKSGGIIFPMIDTRCMYGR